MGNNRKKVIVILLLVIFFVLPKKILIADETEPVNKLYSINLDLSTINKGYTVDGFNGDLKLSLVPGILSQATRVDVTQLRENIPSPNGLERISEIYQFEFRNKAAYDNHKPFYIQFSYSETNNFYKQVYFFDKNYNVWRPLPTTDHPEGFFVRSLIHLPYARIAIFSNPEILTVGTASWFSFYNGNYAASPDYPIGSRLRVHKLSYNADSGKARFVDVTIRDFGPDRSKHPDRVVDLDKIAFSRIASPGEGLTTIHIEPLYVAPEGGKVLAATIDSGSNLPKVTAKSDFVLDEDSNTIFYQKDPDKVLPLASLTKMLAVKVFLECGVKLDKVITYSKQDEEYNYQYCDKSVSARLKVSDGDTLTVKDLIYSSLVGSANNSVESLVRACGIPRNDFIKKMNDTAKKWGAASSRFIEPTGLSPDNVSTVRDYAIIAEETLKDPVIAKATISKDYSFDTINTQIHHYIKNTSSLIRDGSLDITGSKTGYLEEAGYCLMTRVKSRQGNNVIVVIFGANGLSSRNAETVDLANYAMRRIEALNY